MKVEGPTSIKTPATAKRVRGGTGSGDNFAAHLDASPSETAGLTGAAPLSTVSAVLALQGEGDATQGRRRQAMRRANDLLDDLDKIRHALLTGSLPLADLTALAERLAAGDLDAGGDPALAQIVADIEIRCAVELAKLGRDVPGL